jgi:adenylate kinase family enzyme
MTQQKVIIIAGPNGAGKTTFARSFLPEEARCPRFINADLIAAGLSPFAPEAAAIKAGRLMLNEISDCVRRGESFAFETTLAGQGYVRHIRQWRALGYHRISARKPATSVAGGIAGCAQHTLCATLSAWLKLCRTGTASIRRLTM